MARVVEGGVASYPAGQRSFTMSRAVENLEHEVEKASTLWPGEG